MSNEVLEAGVATEAAATDVANSSANFTTELVTYRTYGAFDDKGQATGVKKDKEGNILNEGAPAVQSQSRDGKNWKSSEEKGATILNENAFRFYHLENVAGFDTLVPDEEQRLYIIQKGLDAIQTSAANRYQTETEEKASKDSPDVFAYNGETIDLREAINTPPQRKNLTDEQKFMKAVSVIDPKKAMAMLEALKATLMAQGATE